MSNVVTFVLTSYSERLENTQEITLEHPELNDSQKDKPLSSKKKREELSEEEKSNAMKLLFEVRDRLMESKRKIAKYQDTIEELEKPVVQDVSFLKQKADSYSTYDYFKLQNGLSIEISKN